MIPVHPDWQHVVGELYRAYGTYHAILNALAPLGATPADHAQLCRLRSGKCKRPIWETGAALLNLYAEIQ